MSLLSANLHAAVNVKQIQQQLEETQATWKAKETWVSRLSAAEVHRILGNQETPKNKLNYQDVYSKSLTNESLDWRNVNGVNWVGDILNQGNCGSCVAFATVATLETQVSIATGSPWLKARFSPEALFSCGGGMCEQGWFPSSAASYVTRYGVVDNSCAPYTMGSTGNDVQCRQFCDNQSERTFKVKGSFAPSGFFNSSAQKVKDALKKGPLITTLTVYEDFLTYSSGIYKSVSNKRLGGHAVSLVGYNDAGRYWIIRNSCGKDWGENGFMRVSWDDKSGIAASTIGFNIGQGKEAGLAITTPSENDYVSGKTTVVAQMNNGDNSRNNFQDSNVAIKLMRAGKTVGTLQSSNTDSTGKSVSVLDTTALADGRYELVAVAGSNKSVVRGFTVANRVPAVSVKFSGHNVDLNQPVVGRIEFDINVTSSSVMPQTLDLMVTTVDGKVVAQRTYDVVLNKMLLGFRFNSIPNGDYLVFFRATVPVGGKNYVTDSLKVKVTSSNNLVSKNWKQLLFY